ncbi:MAG TPA: SPOR domain-containing protein, partial [Phenylobacterium sp.]|nr:SPOR domain-containing protein [Phenylobacterium sp.]
ALYAAELVGAALVAAAALAASPGLAAGLAAGAALPGLGLARRLALTPPGRALNARLADTALYLVFPAPPAPPPVMAAAPSPAYRVQAGAFGDRANAERAVMRLSHAGQAMIEPTEGGLYRVVLDAGSDEGLAWQVREQVAQAGFFDARVIQPY